MKLQDELEHVKRYMLIMKMRFEDRLDWEIEAPPEFADVELPRLLLQPLVENAVLHGVESKIEPGWIRLTVARDGERIAITVEDNGVGMDEEKLRSLVEGLESGKCLRLKIPAWESPMCRGDFNCFLIMSRARYYPLIAGRARALVSVSKFLSEEAKSHEEPNDSYRRR